MSAMASCFYCQKKSVTGFRVSHSAIKTKRQFKANIHPMRVRFADGGVKRVGLCSKCYKIIRQRFDENIAIPFVPLSLVNKELKKTPQEVPATA